MAKEIDQTPDEQEDAQTAATAVADAEPVKEDIVSTDKAVKTSEDFDAKLDAEGVDDETTADEDDTEGEKKEPADKAAKTDGDDKTAAKGKGADDTAGDDDGAGEVQISAETVKRAANLGLTPEEIASFENEETLTRTLNVLDNIVKDDGGTEDTAQTPPAGKDAKKDEGEFHMKFENEEEIDPELLKGIRAMEKAFNDKVKELSNKLEGVTGNLQQQAQTEFVARFDGMIAELGEGFADTLGQGPSNQFSNRSSAGRNRAAIRTRMYAFAKGLADAGEKIPDEKSLFEMAVNTLHGDKLKTIAGKQMHDKTKQRAAQARVGRASTRRAGNLTPKQRAVQTSRNFDELIDTSET